MATESVIVVGAGGISDAWFGPLKQEGVRIAAVVDLRKEAAQEKIDQHQLTGTLASDDLQKTLAEFKGKADFVLDLTIPEAHCQVTCQSLAAGFHVLGEKPMAVSMDQARRMLAASENSRKMYMVSQSRRWDKNHIATENAIATGQIGMLTTLNCDFYIGAHFGGFRDEMPSPLILDMAIHHFDLARMFARRTCVAVYAEEFNPHGSWYKGDAAANCIFEMQDQVRFAYRGSWCAEGPHTSWNGDWRIIGDKGTLIMANDQFPQGEIVTNQEGFHREKSPLTIPQPENTAFNMHGSLREMLHFLRTGQKPQTECHDNIHSLAMVFAAIESSKRKERVKLAEI